MRVNSATGRFLLRRRHTVLEPELGRPPASLPQALQKTPVEVAGAFPGQAVKLLVRRYPPDPQPPEFLRGADQLSVSERLELAVERGVELDLLDPGGDLARMPRPARRRPGRDLHDENMRR